MSHSDPATSTRRRPAPPRPHQGRAAASSPTTTPPPVLARLIEQVPIDRPQPYGRALREHSEAQIAKIANSIRMAGFLVPIILDAGDVIVAGHGRWQAARQLGMATVPVIRADHLTPEQVKAYRIADNRLGELSNWNDRDLAMELKELGAIELDPELLELTGFEIGEIDVRIASLDEPEPDEADAVPEPEPVPVSRVGDVWCLGPHRLRCGSSLESDSYARLLEGRQARTVFSDPPYNVAVQGHVSGLGRVQHREFAMASGEMSEAEFTAFLARYLTLTRANSVPGALHYVCMDAAHGLEVLSAARQAELAFKTTCTWAKTNAGMGSLYRQQTEFIHVFKNEEGGAPHLNNVMLGAFGRHRTTLWSYAGANTFRKGRMQDLADHPTVKPWALVGDAIKDCTARGDLVLDAFCGSGTTLIAAEKTGRVGAGIELEPRYVDVAIRRWEALTGRQATLAGSSLTFRAVAEQRQAGQARQDETLAGMEVCHG